MYSCGSDCSFHESLHHAPLPAQNNLHLVSRENNPMLAGTSTPWGAPAQLRTRGASLTPPTPSPSASCTPSSGNIVLCSIYTYMQASFIQYIHIYKGLIYNIYIHTRASCTPSSGAQYRSSPAHTHKQTPTYRHTPPNKS